MPSDLEFVNVAVAVLNRAAELDAEALTKLIDARERCSWAFKDDPTIQVGLVDDDDAEKGFQLGLLGIVNGILGTRSDGWAWMVAHRDTESGLIRAFGIDDSPHRETGDPVTWGERGASL